MACSGLRSKKQKKKQIPQKWKANRQLRIFVLANSKNPPILYRHRIWLGEGSTVQWKCSPPAPGSLKRSLFPTLWKWGQIRGCEGYARGTTRYFLQKFPLSGTPVVQSYRAWTLALYWWAFRGRKKYLAPPAPKRKNNSPQTPSRPLGPSPPGEPPPPSLVGFSIKTDSPPLPAPRTPPSPSPSRKKNSKRPPSYFKARLA